MKNIVFATCLEQPDFQASDQLVADALAARGAKATPAPWNGDFSAFQDADLVVARSTWDYVEAADDFLAWLMQLRELPAVINPPQLMWWNLSKRYMARLREAGAPIVPTKFCAPHVGDVLSAMSALSLDEAIIKPVIGASGDGLSIIRRDDQQGLGTRLDGFKTGVMVQPKVPEIMDPGETSFMFFDGAFSHAVLKTPEPGGVLCQEEHGGVTRRIEPTGGQIDQAAGILRHLPASPAYARVDAIVTDDAFMLMEVELIEPELFLTHAPAQADVFAASILNRLQ